MRRYNQKFSKNTQIFTVGVVVRLSKEDVKKQNKNDNSDSIESQIKLIEEHINHLIDEGENLKIHDYYIDDGKSGALAEDRPSFMRMLNDVEQGIINCVIVKDSSRLARNSSESSNFVEDYFVKKNVRYISLMLPKIDSYKNPEEVGSLATKIYDVVNEDVLRQQSLKTREILYLKMRLGLFVGSQAPFGFNKSPENKHQLIVDDYASGILCNMRDWVFNGMTLKQVQIELHRLSILNPTAYRKSKGEKYHNPHYTPGHDTFWSISTIKRLLLSQMNVGDMVQHISSSKSYKVKERVYYRDDERIVVEETHKAIFSKSDRKKLTAILQKETKTLSHNGNAPYLFTGFLKCADCGKSIARKKGKKPFFQCKSYTNYGNEVCTRHYIEEEELTEAILYSIRSQVSLLEDYEKIVKDVQNSKRENMIKTKLEQSINQLSSKQDKLISAKDSLYMDWKNGDISREDHARLKQNIEIQLEELKRQLLELKNEVTDIATGNYEDAFDSFKKHKNITELNRSILTELIDCIYVHENKEIDIVYRFEDQLEVLKEKSDREKAKVKTLKKK